MVEPVAAFAEAARRFCALVERPPDEARPDVAAALIATLYAAAVDLPIVEPTDVNVDAYRVGAPRRSNFAVQYYSEVLDPLELEAPEIGTGDLDDDLGDIYADVKAGLCAFDAGHRTDAAWYWRLHFRAHWGEHASSALHVLHRLAVR